MTRPTDQIAPVSAPDFLPENLPQAALRGGIKSCCPRCGQAPLFRKWLKPVDRCAHCGQDWTLHNADDFPPYVSIFVTGHLMAPLIILMILDLEMSVAATMAVILPLAIMLMLGILQPAKGAIIALQWWIGMGGFTQERRPEAEGTDA